MGGKCRRQGVQEKQLKGFGGESLGQETNCRTLRREDNIKMDLKSTEIEGVEQIGLFQEDSGQCWATVKFPVPIKCGKYTNF